MLRNISCQLITAQICNFDLKKFDQVQVDNFNSSKYHRKNFRRKESNMTMKIPLYRKLLLPKIVGTVKRKKEIAAVVPLGHLEASSSAESAPNLMKFSP